MSCCWFISNSNKEGNLFQLNFCNPTVQLSPGFSIGRYQCYWRIFQKCGGIVFIIFCSWNFFPNKTKGHFIVGRTVVAQWKSWKVIAKAYKLFYFLMIDTSRFPLCDHRAPDFNPSLLLGATKKISTIDVKLNFLKLSDIHSVLLLTFTFHQRTILLNLVLPIYTDMC